MKKLINSFMETLDSVEFVPEWYRTDFFENLKSCHIETEKSGQVLLVCDINKDDDICIKMHDQEDADFHMNYFLDAKNICKEWKNTEINKMLHHTTKLDMGKTTKNILISYVYLAFDFNREFAKGNTDRDDTRMMFRSFGKMQNLLINYDKSHSIN